jgi:hypothetical protein
MLQNVERHEESSLDWIRPKRYPRVIYSYDKSARRLRLVTKMHIYHVALLTPSMLVLQSSGKGSHRQDKPQAIERKWTKVRNPARIPGGDVGGERVDDQSDTANFQCTL